MPEELLDELELLELELELELLELELELLELELELELLELELELLELELLELELLTGFEFDFDLPQPTVASKVASSGIIANPVAALPIVCHLEFLFILSSTIVCQFRTHGCTPV